MTPEPHQRPDWDRLYEIAGAQVRRIVVTANAARCGSSQRLSRSRTRSAGQPAMRSFDWTRMIQPREVARLDSRAGAVRVPDEGTSGVLAGVTLEAIAPFRGERDRP